ncbi:protein-export chaperone SecB [Puniceibacterium sp. IMCC21224]|uniref:protein-export chaperone SecB n=1 Tax=Puniceibacterium sp. IMCC21224 TaxID=1618204 RepID=UPI00064DFF68|nr:protein-export chaperone SecB [Puniceibacterium sp. IMCC21224]KMK65405.1 protein translocase subunit secB [Puniceibacterium sp. IMCC21224]
MADTNANGAPEQDATAAQMKMNVLAQFIRDMSFENILAQKGTGGEMTPDVQVQVNLDARKRSPDHQFEVVMKLKIDAKSKGTTSQLFLMELEYGGVFHIENVPEEQMHPFLLIECPRMLFPFVRRIVSDVTRDGGFPPLNLETIDFVSLYRNEIARRQAEQQTKRADA